MIDTKNNKILLDLLEHVDLKDARESLVEEIHVSEMENLIKTLKRGAKVLVTKVFSYCNDFNEEEQEILQENQGYDCYIEYQAFSKKYLENQGYDNDIIANKLIELGCLNEEKVLIHLDW